MSLQVILWKVSGVVSENNQFKVSQMVTRLKLYIVYDV